MRRVLYIFFSICFIGCNTNKSKKFVAEELQPRYKENQPLNELYRSQIPSSEELNEKHFYRMISIPNVPLLNSKFFCITKFYPEPIVSLPICGSGYKIYFDPRQVIRFCDSIIYALNKTNLSREENFDINSYKKLKNEAIQSLKEEIKFDENYLLRLLPYCQCYFWDTKTQTMPLTLLIKKYRTMCMKEGNDYDLINAKGDTISLINNLEFCIN